MAKKDNSPVAPVVTTLPLPNSDNAMVIDLPDGQKLFVGKMETGSVIEVATWRGTGRPDSRTTRLMLGVSSQGKVEEPEEQEGAKSSAVKPSVFSQVQSVATRAISNVKNTLSKAKKFKIEKPTTSPTLTAPITSTASSRDADKNVQAWLDSIITKSEKKESTQGTIKPAVKKKTVKKTASKKTSTSRRSR